MQKKYETGLMWFRRDLRIQDNAALYHALKSCKQVYCAFVFDRGILDSKALHSPWLAKPLEVAAAGLVLGKDYPLPVVQRDEARADAAALCARKKGLRENSQALGFAIVLGASCARPV